MELTTQDVVGRVQAELLNMDPAFAAKIRRFLVQPYCVMREWDYGPQTYPCWIVLEHDASGTGIAYCQDGFGPRRPWGLLWLRGDRTSMGPDSSWYDSLANAFLESFAAD
jgi:hypothetical protein